MDGVVGAFSVFSAIALLRLLFLRGGIIAAGLYMRQLKQMQQIMPLDRYRLFKVDGAVPGASVNKGDPR